VNAKDLNLPSCRGLLDPSKANPAPGSVQRSKLATDEVVLRLAWEQGTDEEFDQLNTYMRLFTWATNEEEKKYVDDPIVFGVERPGRWRRVSFESVWDQKTNGFLFIYTIALGYATSLGISGADFGDGSILTKTVRSPGDANEAGGTGHTVTGDEPGIVHFVRWNNISTEKADEALAALPSSVTDPIIGGEKRSGTFALIVSTSDTDQETGGSFVEAVYADTKYVLNTKSDEGTTSQRTIGYIWSLPEALAQAVITGWVDETDTTGRSAIPSYSSKAKTVDLVLTAFSGKENMTTDWIPTTKDRWRRWHFAWGYTEAELGGFIEDHDSPIATVEPAVTGKAIYSRQVNIQTRAGLFDSIIIESTHGPHADVTKADFTITLPIGEKITKQQSYGYNLQRDEMNLDALKDLYDVTAKAVGRRVEFRPTRQDDDSFDYEAVITLQEDDIQDTLTISPAVAGDGATTLVMSAKGLDADEIIEVEADATLQPGIRSTVDVNFEMRDDELADARVTKRTMPEVEDSADSGSDGIGAKVYAASNADVGDLALLVSSEDLVSGIRKRVDLDITPNGDNKSVQYKARVSTVQEATDEAAITGTGINESVWSAKNADVGDLTTLLNAQNITSGPRKRVTLDITCADDGSTIYKVRCTELPEVEDSASAPQDDTDSGITIGVYSGKNKDIGALTALLADTLSDSPPSRRRRVDLDLICQDDLTTTYKAEIREYPETTDSASSGDNGITDAEYIGQATDPGDLSDLITANALKSDRLTQISISLQSDDKGAISYRLHKRGMQEADVTIITGSKGEKLTTRIGQNLDKTTLSALTQPTDVGSEVILQGAGVDDAGNMRFNLVNRDLTEQNVTATGGTWLEKFTKEFSVGDTGNDDLAETPAEGTAYQWQLVLDKDGSTRWEKTTVSYQSETGGSFVAARLRPRLDKNGYEDTVTPFRNIKVASIGSYALASGEYGQITGLTLGPGGLSGTKILRDYDSFSVVQSNPSTSDAINKTMLTMQWTSDGTKYYVLTWTFDDKFTDSRGNAVTFASASTVTPEKEGLPVKYVVLSGQGYWYARKYTNVTRSTIQTPGVTGA